MSKANVFDMFVDRESEDVYENILENLKENKSYNNSVNSIETHLLSIDRKLRTKILDKISTIETEVQKTAYSQGFSDAIKLIMTCMSGGGYCG